MKIPQATVDLLEFYHDKYNNPAFIEYDPISIPRAFSKKQDIEIAGLLAASIAWGQRTTILKNARRLMQLMDNAPHDFILQHREKDLDRFQHFVHRTFNAIDLLYLIAVLKNYFSKQDSLEQVFLHKTIEQGLADLHREIFSLDFAPDRTRKHIATPERGSTCKRLNMYLRWMVRQDDRGVDFGIWKNIPQSQLLCPLDVHVENYARQLKLITRKQRDWLTVMELTANLQNIDPLDPVRFDFALFGMGIEKAML
jgi:uncharacterized protein (TIGR02757 family)